MDRNRGNVFQERASGDLFYATRRIQAVPIFINISSRTADDFLFSFSARLCYFRLALWANMAPKKTSKLKRLFVVFRNQRRHLRFKAVLNAKNIKGTFD